MSEEQNLVDEVKEASDPLNSKELNEAAFNFGKLIPRIKGLARNMGRNALSRVYGSIVEFPLGEQYPKFENKEENELFVLSLSAMAYKSSMMQAVAKLQETTNTAISNAADAVKEDSDGGK